MNWKKALAKGYTLYAAVGFIILILVMWHHVVSQGLRKSILVVVIPAYILLAGGFYSIFKTIKVK